MPNLPVALPPAERTVGQVVAETIRFYGANFWRALPLGLPLAIMREIVLGHRGAFHRALAAVEGEGELGGFQRGRAAEILCTTARLIDDDARHRRLRQRTGDRASNCVEGKSDQRVIGQESRSNRDQDQFTWRYTARSSCGITLNLA